MNLTETQLVLETLTLPLAARKGLRISIARADRVHPLASGNKFYKLLPNIEYAKRHHYSQVLSFGGAFSNHIHALALYSQAVGLRSIAIIRGEKEYASNPTLSAATAAGMTLVFVDRATYKRRNEVGYLGQLQQQYPEALIIPEGGSNPLAVQGCSELMRHINQSCLETQGTIPDTVAVACGTGTTLAGLVNGAEADQFIHGYLVLKDASVLLKVETLLAQQTSPRRYQIHAADLGGYAKFDSKLLNFVLDILQQTDILLDPIYTAKMCYCLMQQIEAGQFKVGSHVVILHSGGLQAWYGMKKKVIILSGYKAWQQIEAYL